MSFLIERMKETDGIFSSSKVSKEIIEKIQKKLFDCGCQVLPVSYMKFLSEVNGVFTDSVSLFGIKLDETSPVLDIFEENENNKNKDLVYLGYNVFSFIVYNWQEKEYQILDRESLNVVGKHHHLEPLLLDILGSYLV